MKIQFVALAAALIVGLAGMVSTAQPASTLRIGLVSSNRILAQVNEARTDYERLRNRQQQVANELKVKQQTLEATRQQIIQATDAATRTKLQQQEEQLKKEMQTTALQGQTELQAGQRQLQTDMQTRLTPLIEEIAKRKGIELVLNGDSSVMWASPALDITSELVQRLNATAAPAKTPPR